MMWTMKRVISGRTCFAAAYLLLFIGFLTVHITRMEEWSSVIDGMIIEGRTTMETPLSPRKIRRIMMMFNGVQLVIGQGHPVELHTEDGMSHRLRVLGWEIRGSGISLELQYGITLTVRVHDGGVSLTPFLPDLHPPARFLEFTLRPPSNVPVSQNDSGRFSIEAENNYSTLVSPVGSSWTPKRRRFTLAVSKKEDLEILFDTLPESLSASEWYEGGDIPNETVFNTALEQWLTQARQGWNPPPDSRRTDVWAAAVLADAQNRNRFPESLRAVRGMLGGTPPVRLATPYLGGIVVQGNAMARDLGNRADELRRSIEHTPEVVSAEDVTILLTAGDNSALDVLLEHIRISDHQDVSSEKLLNHIKALQDADAFDLGKNGDDTLRRRLIDQVLLPRIRWMGEGLWLFDEGVVNVETSVFAGRLLINEPESGDLALYRTVGRGMILSALEHADSQGLFPAVLTFSENGAIDQRETLPPEKLYPLIVADAAYPRIIPLFRELGTGAWAWTVAARLDILGNTEETVITMEFPEEAAHYVMIVGVRPFVQLFMNGLLWRSDSNFQSYSAGWSYDEGRRTLYLKLTHRPEIETIRILHQVPEQTDSEDGEEN